MFVNYGSSYQSRGAAFPRSGSTEPSAFCRTERYVQAIHLEWVQNGVFLRVSFGLEPVCGIKSWPVGGRYELSKCFDEPNRYEHLNVLDASDEECLIFISTVTDDIRKVVVPFFEKTARSAFETVARTDARLFPVYRRYLSSFSLSKKRLSEETEYQCNPMEIGEAKHLYSYAIAEHRYSDLIQILKSLLTFYTKRIEIYERAIKVEGDSNGAYRLIVQNAAASVERLQLQLEKAGKQDDSWFDTFIEESERQTNELLPVPLRSI